MVKEFKRNGIILARHIELTDLKDGLSFYSDESDFLQVGSWKYNKAKELKAHTHNKAERKITHTQEVLIILKGEILAEIYDNKKELVDTICVRKGGILILLSGGHGYRILEDDTRVIEIKNGPYLGADKDRTII